MLPRGVHTGTCFGWSRLVQCPAAWTFDRHLEAQSVNRVIRQGQKEDMEFDDSGYYTNTTERGVLGSMDIEL